MEGKKRARVALCRSSNTSFKKCSSKSSDCSHIWQSRVLLTLAAHSGMSLQLFMCYKFGIVTHGHTDLQIAFHPQRDKSEMSRDSQDPDTARCLARSGGTADTDGINEPRCRRRCWIDSNPKLSPVPNIFFLVLRSAVAQGACLGTNLFYTLVIRLLRSPGRWFLS